jgi:ADP-heptose:LPS heptosyltransferase
MGGMAALDASAHIQNFASELNDFDDTAALVECMDWVISVDTSVAHLAGALGKPLCLLLPFVPDWRWLLERETSPWYPSATLYRQTALDDWDGVLTRLRRDIETRVFEGALNKT